LQHGLRIGCRCRHRINVPQFFVQGVHDKAGCGFQSAVQKNRARDRFKDIRQQSMLAPAAALLFSAPEPNKLAQTQFS